MWYNIRKSQNIMTMTVASTHLNKHDHDFNNYGKFKIIEQLRNK